ncbi:hypothetical protein AX15_003602 [Amanita polypyramis BW_CC]|nr:hypothetical protein AX15_003602 [Amanita polypyramis BW_CC]
MKKPGAFPLLHYQHQVYSHSSSLRQKGNAQAGHIIRTTLISRFLGDIPRFSELAHKQRSQATNHISRRCNDLFGSNTTDKERQRKPPKPAQTAMLCSHACRHSQRILPYIRPRTRLISDLGLRSRLPPDSSPQFDTDNAPSVSDREWEIRTGRAVFVLQNTLPRFFETGLITSVDTVTGIPDDPPSSMGIVGDVLRLPISSTSTLKHSISPGKSDTKPPDNHYEAIYSPKIRLSYTPPVALPIPFPKTLSIEGLPLYIASSTFIRHTLKALYTDLRVEVNKFVVYNPNSGSPPSPGGFFTGSSSGHDFFATLAHPSRELNNLGGQMVSGGKTGEEPAGNELNRHGEKKRRVIREKSVLVGLKVHGVARVSGAPIQWDVTSTYSFSPLSGFILTHVINSIHPEPHQAVYDSLRSNLGKVFGWETGAPTGFPRPANMNVQPATGTTGCMDAEGHDRHCGDGSGRRGK